MGSRSGSRVGALDLSWAGIELLRWLPVFGDSVMCWHRISGSAAGAGHDVVAVVCLSLLLRYGSD